MAESSTPHPTWDDLKAVLRESGLPEDPHQVRGSNFTFIYTAPTGANGIFLGRIIGPDYFIPGPPEQDNPIPRWRLRLQVENRYFCGCALIGLIYVGDKAWKVETDEGEPGRIPYTGKLELI